MKHTKMALIRSVIALLLCVSMFVGTTFAWFTDSVTSTNNIIQTGILDVELEWFNEAKNEWQKVNQRTNVFDEDALWEPGHTEVVYLRVVNAGSLALKYQLGVNVASETWGTNVYGNPFKLSDYIKMGAVMQQGESFFADRQTARNAFTASGTLSSGYTTTGYMEAGAQEQYIALVVYMPEEVDNVANYKTGTTPPQINLGITLMATQMTSEDDSFGKDYDENATFPALPAGSVSVDVTPDANGYLTEAAQMVNSAGTLMATVPAGVKVGEGVTKLTLSVKELEATDTNITLGENEIQRSIDVHVEGVAADNTQPIIITVREAMMTGLNMGNYALYHVENGADVPMTYVASGDPAAHNDFYYDPATGDVTLAMATFSEVAVVADTEKAWEGKLDYSWYDANATELTIANADQLAAFGAIVGGMAKDENGNFLISYTDSDGDIHHNDSFSGKTVKLISDINLGDKESENNPNIIFYPIGYWNSEGTYKKTNTAISSGFYAFEGTFDGNGNTISNFYQNTWEMKGDHNWYDATLQYYRDGMGLFGKIYGGTVKNLTVNNFSSDGEIATTGVIAAYADGATFENIAITNCNPRVYNIGNGGIVGCVGWYAKKEKLETTFTNITVDNSNKISALWGSYDVACGGIVGQYYPTSGQSSAYYPENAGIHFENCHVAAVMDVYNDVCANYQYYAYRYTGMMIGSIRENETIDGHVYPKMDGITANGCTVHFGTWNDYYYCELVANSLASYTHDHQMSRLTQVASVDVENMEVTDLDGKTTAIPTSGRVNYVVVKAKDANGQWIHGDGEDYATCYHFVNGKQHRHDVADTDNPEIYETVNGEQILKEDKQHIYLEFNQLFTGYGWGVTSKGLTDFSGIENMDIIQGDHENSVEKFESNVTELANNREYKLGDIFAYVYEDVKLVSGALTVSVTNLAENNPVSATIVYDRTNWENGTITLTGTGEVKITIQDYYFCTPTTITVNVTERQEAEKFDIVMNNGDFLHRVGNSGTVALDKLFKAKDGVTVGTISVTIETVDNTGASGTYIADRVAWEEETIQFSGTGVVKVTIKDDDTYCTPTVLYLEVVDAVNATTATSATANNVVLLNDISGGFVVSGRYTVYGNGFTLNYTGNGQYLNNGLKQGVVTVSENGTLDNLRIKAPIYPAAYLYYSEAQAGPSVVEGDKTRYYYQLSAVVAKGNATISNCYIYGGRTNIFIDTGNVTITDTITECGTLANIQIQSTSASTITLNNITTIQYRVNPTIGDTSLTMLGAGIIVGPDTETNPTIVLDGCFKQYNWVTAADAEKVSNSTAKSIIETAVNAAAFNHTVSGVTASNLGIIYMNTEEATVTNNTGLPYEFGDVSVMKQDGQVYSLQNAAAEQIQSDYANADRSTVNGDYIPIFDFNLGNQEISYDGSDDSRYLCGDENGVTALYQDGTTTISLDVTTLATIYKYAGMNYTVTAACKDSSGNTLTATNGAVTLSAQGSYSLVFTVEDNIFYNNKGESVTKSVTRTYTVPLTLTVKEADVKNAEVSITKTALDGVYTTVNLTDYKLRINFLDCISITDYNASGTGTTVDLTSNIASATLTPASVNVFTTAFTATITYTDGRVLTVNFSKISGSSAGTKTATVNTSGGVYFITDGALDNKPTESSSQNKCTITSVSFKGNSGSTVTNDTDVTVTWELGSSSGGGGCVIPDTLVTLADGTQKEIQYVTHEDMLLVWNFYTGEYDAVPASIVMNHGYDNYTVVSLKFDDGTVVNTINGHGFFDAATNEYVILGESNAADYIGHDFVKVNGDGYATVKLVEYSVKTEYTESWSILTADHYNCILEGMWTVTPAEVEGSPDYLMPFEVGEDMKYDAAKMQADIEKYGLYTYEDFAGYCTYEQFVGFGFANWKVAVGKGYITWEDILYLISIHIG